MNHICTIYEPYMNHEWEFVVYIHGNEDYNPHIWEILSEDHVNGDFSLKCFTIDSHYSDSLSINFGFLSHETQPETVWSMQRIGFCIFGTVSLKYSGPGIHSGNSSNQQVADSPCEF